jgi:hypothetical protein
MEIIRVRDAMGRESWQERTVPELAGVPGDFEEWINEPEPKGEKSHGSDCNAG